MWLVATSYGVTYREIVVFSALKSGSPKVVGCSSATPTSGDGEPDFAFAFADSPARPPPPPIRQRTQALRR